MTILFMGSYINNRDIVYKRPPVSPYVSYGSLEAASRHYPRTCKTRYSQLLILMSDDGLCHALGDSPSGLEPSNIVDCLSLRK